MNLYLLDKVSYKASVHVRALRWKCLGLFQSLGWKEVSKAGQESGHPQQHQGVRKRIMSKTGMKGKGKADKRRKEQVQEVRIGKKKTYLRWSSSSSVLFWKYTRKKHEAHWHNQTGKEKSFLTTRLWGDSFSIALLFLCKSGVYVQRIQEQKDSNLLTAIYSWRALQLRQATLRWWAAVLWY